MTNNEAQKTDSKMQKSDHSDATTTTSTTSTATIATITSTTTTSTTSEMKQDPESKSTKKPLKYSEFTSIYGMYCSYNDRGNSLLSRHKSLEDANRAAEAFFENTKRQNAIESGRDFAALEHTEIHCESPFRAFTTLGGCNSTCYITVKEIGIKECHLPELKVIARRENVFVARKSKEQLMAILEPIIHHKKHQNNWGKDIDIKHCKQCQSEHVEEYQKYIENDPIAREERSMKKMYRKSVVNGITQNQVERQYGLTFEDLKEGIVTEQLHFTRKGSFPRYYWKFEVAEINRFYRKKKMEKKQKRKKERTQRDNVQNEDKSENAETEPEKESDGKDERTKKRPFESFEAEGESIHCDSKKRKLNDNDNDNKINKAKDIETNEQVDYKGVPPHLRKFKWLYIDSALTDEGRVKIIKFLTGKYMRSDVEHEDVLLTRAEVEDGLKRILEETVFRMFFVAKIWKRVSVRRML